MLGLTSHTYEGRNVRTSIDGAGQPVAIAQDVCELFGREWRKVRESIPEWAKGGAVKGATLGGDQTFATLTLAGVYWVALRADTPEAAPLQKWVCTEILPSIGKTGRYAIGDGYTITTTGEARVAQLRALTQCERWITLYTARRDAVLRGELGSAGGDRGEIAVEGAVPLLPHLRAAHPALALEHVRVLVQLAVNRLKRAGLPVGRGQHEGKWLRTARPADVATVLTAADLAGKGGA